MNTYTRALILAAMTAVSLTQGCSCSDSDDPAPQVVVDPPDPSDPVDPPVPTVTTISGVAAKGLVLGGLVNVHPIIDGVLGDSIANGVTGGNDGDYSVSINDYDGSPFVVRVSAADDGSTSMVCDLAGGCGGGVAFGGRVTLDDPDFNLDAIVPPVSDPTTSVNLSVLTDTATDLALNTLASDSDVTIDDVITAVSNANGSIANRFGIQGDITTLPIVDLTNPTAVAAANSNVINFNLLSSSIVEALITSNSNLSIASAVQAFASQYVDQGGLADTESSAAATVTLAEILAQASSVIDAIQAADTTGLTNLDNLEAIIDTNQQLAEQGSTEPDLGTPNTGTGGDPLENAKALVELLGDLEGSINATALSSDGNITLGVKSEDFEGQLNAAELAASEGVELVLEATAKVVDAFGEAWDAYDAHEGSEPFTQWQSDNGVVVSVSEMMSSPSAGEDAVVESVKFVAGTEEMPISVPVYVDDTMAEVSVAMMAMEAIDVEDTETDSSETVTIMGEFSISGTAETSDVVLTVKEGSMVSLEEAMEVYSETETSDQTDFEVSGLQLVLEALIAQKESATVTDPVSFDGSVIAMLESFDGSESYVWTDNGGMETISEEISMLSLDLAGSIMNSSGDAVSIVFGVAGSGSSFDFELDPLGGLDGDDEEANTDEDSFMASRMNIAFQADMAGVDEAFNLLFVMTRDEDDEAEDITLKMWYDDINLQFTTRAYDDESANQSLVLSDQNDVVLTVRDTDDGVVGEIYVGLDQVAEIEGAIVTFTDGVITSLDILDDEE